MMDREKKIDRIVRGWETRGFQPGLDTEEMRGIAAIALDAAEGPEEWEPSDTIPNAQTTVYDDRGIQWHREHDDESDVWTATVLHGDFQNQVGTVYERPVETTDRTHGQRVDGQARAYLQVLAHTADVLDAATEALTATGQTYRQKRGFTSGLCRTVEAQAEQTGHASTTIKELIKEAEGE